MWWAGSDWEAEVLDERRLRDWLSLLADDVSYRMPVTVTAGRGSERASGGHGPLG